MIRFSLKQLMLFVLLAAVLFGIAVNSQLAFEPLCDDFPEGDSTASYFIGASLGDNKWSD